MLACTIGLFFHSFLHAQLSPIGIASSDTVAPVPYDNPTRGWVNVSSVIHPSAMAGAMMAYDNKHNMFLLFGGWNGTGLSETWIYNLTTYSWLKLHPAVNPSAQGDGMLVYDASDDFFILFGGWVEPSPNVYHRLADTWIFIPSNQSWITRQPAHAPQNRSDSAVAYDEKRGVVLLVGGFDGSNYLGDIWDYSPKNDTWQQRGSAITPSPRADGRMVYDPDNQLFYLFGGNDFSGANFTFHHLGDTWTFNWTSNKWSQIATNPSPPLRDYPILAYDSSSKVLLLFGGYGNSTILGDVWTFDSTREIWSNITPDYGPPSRFAAVGDFAETIGAFFLFGGLTPEGLKADSWLFRYPPPLSGTILLSSASPITGKNLTFQAEIHGGSGNLAHVKWFFGDGQVDSRIVTTHAYRQPGIYTVQLEVGDSRGQQISLTLQIPVGIWAPLWTEILLVTSGISAVLAILIVKSRWPLKAKESKQ